MNLPKIYEQENYPIKMVYKIYYGHCGRKSLWYIFEADEKDYFGWGGFFDDPDMAEFGYIPRSELENYLIFDEFKLDNPIEFNSKLKDLLLDIEKWKKYRDDVLPL